VTAREEERRRLRRDLHDGIGPTLAGMSLQLLAAHRMVDPDGDAAGVLDALRGDLRTCLAETRQLVDQLRPAALDHGLREGLATECRRFDADRLRVTLRAGEQLDGLPAAVEVAAYRIVAEALTNVARHAEARTVLVDVRRGNGLELDVVDDGVGLSGTGRRGVGLDSMRERAEELGGECEIGSSEPHGTTVRVRLPLPNGTRERAQVVGSGVG
jgi:two-component system NarL family sensor kinase